MSPSPDRKLDLFGVVLAVVVVLGVGLLVFGAIEASQDGGDETPDANFTVERVNDTHVRLEHAGGDVVRGEELVITIDGRERVTHFPPAVSEGDGTAVQVGEGHTIRIYWTGGQGPRDRIDSVTT